MNFSNNMMGVVAPIVTGFVVGRTHSFIGAFLVAGLASTRRHRRVRLPARPHRAPAGAGGANFLTQQQNRQNRAWRGRIRHIRTNAPLKRVVGSSAQRVGQGNPA